MLSRLNAAMPSASMLVAMLALLVATGSAGYAATLVGTADLRRGAVTAAKVRPGAVTAPKIANGAVNGSKIANGSITAADLVGEQPYRYVGRPGQPALVAGTCPWFSGSEVLPGVSDPGFRRDRFGLVRLTGAAERRCPLDPDPDPVLTPEVVVAFRLPVEFRPATTQLVGTGSAPLIIVGPHDLEVTPGTVLPAGSVAVVNKGGNVLVALAGISFEPIGSPLVRR